MRAKAGAALTAPQRRAAIKRREAKAQRDGGESGSLAKSRPPTPDEPSTRGKPRQPTGPRLVLKAGKEKSLLRRHPWVFASAVARVQDEPAPGQTVAVYSAEGEFLAWAAFSPKSSILARAWSYQLEQFPDATMISARVAAAVAQRAPLCARTNAQRLIFGEADQLPGLVVDRYADQLVVQFLAVGVEHWRDTILAALVQATGCGNLYERSDAAAREREGLAVREGTISGATPSGPIEIVEDGVRYAVDVLAGHKTGFYIDQRDSRALVAALARGRSLLNCFCYTGGFTLAALRGGAVSALSIDSSEPALEQARANHALNESALRESAPREPASPEEPMRAAPASAAPPRGCEWRCANVFEALNALGEAGRRFDLIVLDPPKFAPSAQHLDRAARAYKEINMKALKLLAPGGHLLTFSCSGGVSVDLFQKIVAGAVIDARVDTQLLARLHAGSDHPMLMTHPEGEYLKGLLLQRV